MGTILIFPAGLPESICYAYEAEARGAKVIGASSLPFDPARPRYKHWLNLPYIYEAGFEEALLQQIRDQRIDAIFSPHEVIRAHLLRLLPAKAPNVRMIRTPATTLPLNRSQIEPPYYELLDFLADLRLQHHADPIGAEEYQDILRRVITIRGESGVNKLVAMVAVGACTPPGDLVEIGVLFGRSAFLLAWLARRYAIGRLLCIDPWQQDEALQFEAPDILRQATRDLDFNAIFAEFKRTFVPAFLGTVNYIRDTSSNVAELYRSGNLAVGPTEFGMSRYRGTVSLLHIDGNHDYRVVSRDLADWVPLVQTGGWIIIDDYRWPFADGPQRAADQFCFGQQRNKFSHSFVTDGALFIQKQQ